ncbi:UDP-N-acetylglucosamine 2-epimerase [Pelagibacteraceae bacterium]|nr:UDP-N-acetylglucosamine 2-epimerase [Pelagibacteraceae bacterium]
MKKICFVSTSRSDFNMIQELIKESIKFKGIKTQLISYKNFKNKNVITKKIFIKEKNNSNVSVAISFSNYVNSFTKILSVLKPNIFVVFGDRFEMLAATISSYILRIPIAHIAGGEKTFGSIDEGFRHSITKLSNLHFPTKDQYKKIILQIGENPNTIFNYGSLNEQAIYNNKFLNKSEIEKALKIKFLKRNIIFTYHPETIHKDKSLYNLELILKEVKKLKKTLTIVTSPNNDSEGIKMKLFIKSFIKKNRLKNIVFRENLGTQLYISILKIIDLVLGNSSSGISEAPLFATKIINLGDRQKGRVMSKKIINCTISKKSINKSLTDALKSEKNLTTSKIIKKHVSKNIIKKLLSFKFEKYNMKVFNEI